MSSPWKRRPHGEVVDQQLNDAVEACEEAGASRHLIWSRLNALLFFMERDDFAQSKDPSIPLKVPPQFKLVCPPTRQLMLPFDVVGPTARGFEPDPDAARTAAKLAAGWHNWGKDSA